MLSQRYGQVIQDSNMVYTVYVPGGAPQVLMGVLMTGSSRKMYGPGPADLLHPNDLHGLPKKEAPDRCVVTFFCRLTGRLRCKLKMIIQIHQPRSIFPLMPPGV